MYATGRLARAMLKPVKIRQGPAKHLLRFLAGTAYVTIVYKKEDIKLAAFSDSN